jgi:photosystem II stability/assembly factor-like uncharacterized protein
MAVHDKILTAQMGSVWVQPDGPNTDCYQLACAEVGDLSEPMGETVVSYCPDHRKGGWKVVSRAQGLPDRPSLPITVLLGASANWLETNKDCPMPIYLNQTDCGRRDSFLNFQRNVGFHYGSIGSITEANLLMRTAVDESTQAFEISGDEIERAYQPHVEATGATGDTEGLNDVIFVDSLVCAPGACGPAGPGGMHGFMVADSRALGAAGNVYETLNGGTTWAAVTAPFVGLDNVMSITAFAMLGGVRLIVVRDDLSGGGGPLDTEYSDDWGVSWTQSTAGAAAGEVALYGGALFSLDEHNVWLVTDTPNIYKSVDGGLTWAAQANGAAAALNYVRFIDENYGIAVGVASEIQLTSNGGTLWADSVGLPAGKGAVAINCCDILDKDRMWVGYTDGTLFYTVNGGTTWVQRTFSLPPGSIVATTLTLNDVHFLDDFCGFMVVQWQSAGPVAEGAVYRTVNGGRDWQYYLPAASTIGFFNAIWGTGYDTAFVAGELTAVGPLSYRLLI